MKSCLTVSWQLTGGTWGSYKTQSVEKWALRGANTRYLVRAHNQAVLRQLQWRSILAITVAAALVISLSVPSCTILSNSGRAGAAPEPRLAKASIVAFTIGGSLAVSNCRSLATMLES
ncbi:MAG: hypothetical protein JO099_15360 [Acidobacteriia bacterium]|nr:hypothetical protein [Terriglobia bacterium]